MNPIKAINAWLESAATPEERAYRTAYRNLAKLQRAAIKAGHGETPELAAARERVNTTYEALALSRGQDPATGPVGTILRGAPEPV